MRWLIRTGDGIARKRWQRLRNEHALQLLGALVLLLQGDLTFALLEIDRIDRVRDRENQDRRENRLWGERHSTEAEQRFVHGGSQCPMREPLTLQGRMLHDVIHFDNQG